MKMADLFKRQPMPRWMKIVFVFIGLVYLALFFIVRDINHDKAIADQAAAKLVAEERAREASEREAACLVDLQCAADRHKFDALMACSKPIEARAKYDFEWTDGWGKERFDRALWKDDKIESGVIYFGGRALKFTNGFGAKSIMKYACVYNVATKKAESVVVEYAK